MWVANSFPDVLCEFSNSGLPLSPSAGYTNGGLLGDGFLAVDGAGNIWVVNSNTGVSNASLSKFLKSGAPISPSGGYGKDRLSNAAGIAVDGSGNIWVANESNSSLTEIVGAAAPVVTPLAAGVKNNKLGQRP